MRAQTFIYFFVFLALLFLGAPVAVGQSLTTGDVSGTLCYPSRAAVPNITVTLKNLYTGSAQSITLIRDFHHSSYQASVRVYGGRLAPGGSHALSVEATGRFPLMPQRDPRLSVLGLGERRNQVMKNGASLVFSYPGLCPSSHCTGCRCETLAELTSTQ